MDTPRYEIYITENKDGTKNATIRDNELMARWLVDGGGDGKYTWTLYDLDDHSMALLNEKYKEAKIYNI